MNWGRIFLYLIFLDDLLRYGRMIWIYRRERRLIWKKMRLKHLGALLYTTAWISAFLIDQYHRMPAWAWVVLILPPAVFRSYGAWRFELYLAPLEWREQIQLRREQAHLLIVFCRGAIARYRHR